MDQHIPVISGNGTPAERIANVSKPPSVRVKYQGCLPLGVACHS